MTSSKVSSVKTSARTAARGCQSAESDRVSGPMRSLSFSLRPYQSNGIRYLRNVNGRGALFWEMRLGKTIVTIKFLSQRRDARRILVVAPYSALAGWRDELWREGQLTHSIYKDEPGDRADYFYLSRNDAGWFLVNWECHRYVDILSYDWDAIVMDETWIANPKAAVTKYFLSSTKSKYRILLTGTPAPETELQYWSQLEWIQPGVTVTKSFWDYRIRWFRPEGFDWKMSVRGRQFLAGVLARSCSVLKRSDVGLQKEVIFKKWMVQLTPRARTRYQAAEMALLDDRILKFAGERWNAARRICSGPEKEKDLTTLLEGDLAKDRVIIWANYVEEVERLADLLDCRYIHGAVGPDRRDKVRAEFLHGQGTRLVAQPECWKFGTNLTGVDTVIFFSLPSGLMTWQQVCERTVDLSSNKSLFIITFLAADTVEEDILEGLYAKESNQKAVERIRRGAVHRQAAAQL